MSLKDSAQMGLIVFVLAALLFMVAGCLSLMDSRTAEQLLCDIDWIEPNVKSSRYLHDVQFQCGPYTLDESDVWGRSMRSLRTSDIRLLAKGQGTVVCVRHYNTWLWTVEDQHISEWWKCRLGFNVNGD